MKETLHTRPVADSGIEGGTNYPYVEGDVPFTQAFDVFQMGKVRYAREGPLLQYQLRLSQ